MHVLLLQNHQEEVREKFTFFIESKFEASVQQTKTIGEALAYLSKGTPAVNLIIYDMVQESQEEGKSFLTKAGGIPTILCKGKEQPLINGGGSVKIAEREKLTEEVAKAIDAFMAEGVLKNNKTAEAYVRIKTKLLLSVVPLKGDVYIRLSSAKHVKLFKGGDVFDINDMEKYTVQKGVQYLYIRKEQCKEFAEKYIKELQKNLNENVIPLEKAIKLEESSLETVHEMIEHVGFTQEAQELTKTQVKITVKSMGKEPSLSSIMQKLKEMGDKYIAAHSTLCAHLACAIAVQMQWGSHTTFHKLTLAAFMHDITLHNHELAQINSLLELEKVEDKFTPEEVKAFRDHPIAASALVTKITEIPPDVDTIIRQHHERPDGTGFPGSLENNYIAPLAAVFIVAHDLTQFLLKQKSDIQMGQFINSIRDKYKSTHFRKIVACLENLQPAT